MALTADMHHWVKYTRYYEWLACQSISCDHVKQSYPARKQTDFCADVLETVAVPPPISCGFVLHLILCAHQADAAAGRHAAATAVCAAPGREQSSGP